MDSLRTRIIKAIMAAPVNASPEDLADRIEAALADTGTLTDETRFRATDPPFGRDRIFAQRRDYRTPSVTSEQMKALRRQANGLEEMWAATGRAECLEDAQHIRTVIALFVRKRPFLKRIANGDQI